MKLDVYQPTFLIEIEGRRLSRDITHEITSFVFEDNEEELDVMELSITDRNLRFRTQPGSPSPATPAILISICSFRAFALSRLRDEESLAWIMTRALRPIAI